MKKLFRLRSADYCDCAYGDYSYENCAYELLVPIARMMLIWVPDSAVLCRAAMPAPTTKVLSLHIDIG